MTAAVHVTGLTRVYGNRAALRGLDLEVSWGQILTVFGPNGSGKTTLIRVLAGLARPTSGSARIAGFDVTRAAEEARGCVGVVTHQTLLYDDLTARENLHFHARLFGIRDAQQHVAALARTLAIEPYLGLRVRTLSHGVQKRISLARAILHSPPLLLLDEPETGLDQQALELLDSLLVQHRAAGGSAILTTHSLERGLRLADRVAILDRGRLAYQGPRDALDAADIRGIYLRTTGDRQ